MLGLLAQSMFVATRVAPLANSATGRDRRQPPVQARDGNQEENGQGLCKTSTLAVSRRERVSAFADAVARPGRQSPGK
jgi:hypothetical protein